MSIFRKPKGDSDDPIDLAQPSVSDDELDCMVADMYVTAGGTPDQQRMEHMRLQFRQLHGLDRVDHGSFQFADATEARDEKTYNRRTPRGLFAGMCIRLYKTKVDRVLGLLLGAATVGVGAGEMFNVFAFSTQQLISLIVVMVGVLLGAGVFESGRLGYLANLNWNHIDDLGASLPAFIVRGHHRVHEEEQAMVRRASSRRPQRLLLVELWNRQRSVPGTKQSISSERAVDALLRSNPNCDVRTAVSATPETWEHCAEILHRRCGKADQRFFYENPLQVDVLLTDDEAILSFPRGRGDRGFGVIFRSRGIVSEFWEILESQVGDRTRAEMKKVESSNDIQEIKKWVLDDQRAVGAFPHRDFMEPSRA